MDRLFETGAYTGAGVRVDTRRRHVCVGLSYVYVYFIISRRIRAINQRAARA